MSDRILRSALGALLLIGTLVSCKEQVTGSLGCPELCTDESAAVRDTVLLGAIVVDTTFNGFPRPGEDRDVSLWNNLDTADVRLVARFDSLPLNYQIVGASSDSLIRRVDSASLIFTVDTILQKGTFPLTIDAFDVDTTAADSLTSALVPLFRADRLIGSQTFTASDLKVDTLRLGLDNAALFAKIRDTLRLRVGLRVRGQGSSHIRVLGNSFVPRIRFRVSADTTIAPDTIFPRSKTPPDDANIQSAYTLYKIIAAGALPLPPLGSFSIGGFAGGRAYLRFDIPTAVLDSVQVIRASLLLTQRTARSTAAIDDTLTVFTQPVLASPSVTDIFTASQFIGGARAYGIDSVRFAARDSGQKSIELVNLLRFWKSIGPTNTSRSVVLRALQEGATPAEANFFSIEGPAALRPRLRLTYVPRRGFGIP
ncbi:MAG: hypothetical protein ABI664_15960 [bacterium]